MKLQFELKFEALYKAYFYFWNIAFFFCIPLSRICWVILFVLHIIIFKLSELPFIFILVINFITLILPRRKTDICIYQNILPKY